jgi:hypothetical protein
MHIHIELRGYEDERPQIDEAERLIEHFLEHKISDAIIDVIGEENIGDEEDFVDWGFDTHFYARPEGEEERYWTG